ncbi:amino acid adenylation domain-containing protein [Sphaerisporangium album]|uniref:Amino acid adenylation domain-containing protein n=1 Tax=Sphaerisporangium album TaxID=509200 RepID=A0A367F8D8_9ACTN|nr:AMP-binding protein [Sphaerisporangium album]RCG26209.1 amino acid adenylation domain-containing protein [Sphaerisporangium album]
MENRTLYQWFAASAERYPGEPALEIGDQILTYRELEERVLALSARVAVPLTAAPGVDGTPRVALVASRTLSAYVGYLAIQRAGAAVLPLNPDHPEQRNLDIAQRAGVVMALVDGRRADPFATLPRRFRPPVLTIGDDPEPAGAEGPPPVPTDTEAEAYIQFTSGSTGRPKGVPIRHRNISPYIAHNIARYEVGVGGRLSQVFGLTFDVSAADLFVTWGGGATLVVPDQHDLYHPVEFITGRRLTHWFSVPSSARVAQQMGNLPLGRATGLRHSLFGGEAVTMKHAELWRKVAPNSDIHNLYGPTETTINCTEHRLTGDPSTWTPGSNGTVPIGVMYPGMEALVLDDQGRRADEGELCLRGTQRFDGYLDPQENVGRFVLFEDDGPAVLYDGSEPLTARHWYRTGDRVRVEGGYLVCSGRLDQQVKILGHRIELGEVEAAMRRHPDVMDAAVVGVSDDGETRLYAFYTGTELPPAEFDHWLRREIPIHMVPTKITYLEKMPLSENGKTDRGKLAEMPA